MKTKTVDPKSCPECGTQSGFHTRNTISQGMKVRFLCPNGRCDVKVFEAKLTCNSGDKEVKEVLGE